MKKMNLFISVLTFSVQVLWSKLLHVDCIFNLNYSSDKNEVFFMKEMHFSIIIHYNAYKRICIICK